MKFKIFSITGWLFCAMSVPFIAFATEPVMGQQQYETRCAMCHGPAGQGDGWLAKHLLHPVPALAHLKSGNGGEFPYERAYLIIDGRKDVRLHGERDMPVWGEVYRRESGAWRLRSGTAEHYVDVKIQDLMDYLSAIQE